MSINSSYYRIYRRKFFHNIYVSDSSVNCLGSENGIEVSCVATCATSDGHLLYYSRSTHAGTGGSVL